MTALSTPFAASFESPRPRALACAVMLALVASPAQALMLGEPEVRSHLGRPLDVRIPVEGAGAADADAGCFAIVPGAGSGVSSLARAQLAVEQHAGRTFLHVRSSEPIVEPATLLRVRAACPPANGILVRQYGILLDPVPASQPSAPIVAALGEPAHPLTPSLPDAVSTPASASTGAIATDSARSANTPSATAAKAGPARPNVSSRRHATRSTARPHRASHPHVAPPPTSRGGYMLKLSGPVLDLAPSLRIDDAQRAQLREQLALLDADDYTSAMLALRDRMDVLQRRLAALQAQAARLESADEAAPSPLPAVPVAAMPSKASEPSAFRGAFDAAWAWALVALLGLLALLWPLSRVLARRKRIEDVAAPPARDAVAPGVETGRFAPPPPEVIAPQAAAATPGSTGAPALALDDTEEAIRSARDLYNAGERLQAAGVLRLAIESHPERVAPWLPLFDLLLRERLVTEFAELARGFRALHAASPAWKTVQRAGQQIDPGNPLYGADSGAAHEAAA